MKNQKAQQTNIRKREGLLSKSGLELITTEKEGQTVSKTPRRLHPKGRKSSEIGHISKLSNGWTEWREGSTICIG